MASAIRGSESRRGFSRRSGIAGEINVSDAIKSGRNTATSTATAAPKEFPDKCTGPASSRSSNPITTSAFAWRVKPNPSGGSERPKPGRSRAMLRSRPASSPARSVQFVDEPASPCRCTAVGAFTDGPGVSRRCSRIGPQWVGSSTCRPGGGFAVRSTAGTPSATNGTLVRSRRRN